MNASERREYILECLSKTSFVDVGSLSQALNVSEMTIRRDFVSLEKEELLLRVHGGARSYPVQMFEPPLKKRLLENADAKLAIGKCAASFVNDGDVIAVDASSTSFTMLRFLQHCSFRIITNHISVVLELEQHEGAEIILLGGFVRKKSLSLVGYDIQEISRKYHVDKLFFSSKSVDAAHGVSDATVEEGETKKALLRCAEKNYLLMDDSKLGTQSFYNVCPLDAVDCIITNEAQPSGERQKGFYEHCRNEGVSLLFAGKRGKD